MRGPLAFSRNHHMAMVAVCAVLAGCETTAVTVTPPFQAPVCDTEASALVLWAPQWRPNQKEIPKREIAATTGLEEFLKSSGCFGSSELRHLPNMTPAVVAAEVDSARGRFGKVVTITLHELGPVIKLLSSLAIIEGGTEVVLQIAEYELPVEVQTRAFTVHWKNGGPGVIKGVASLPQDMQAALAMGLQPNKPQK
jgi:hypothetical protein